MQECIECGKEFKKEDWMEEGTVTTLFCSTECFMKYIKRRKNNAGSKD